MPAISTVRDWDLPNRPIIDYKWEKIYEEDDDHVAAIRDTILIDLGLSPSVGDRLTLGSLKLIVIATPIEPPWDVLVVRDLGWKSWVWVRWFRIKQFFSKINRRVLLTLEVWGLGKHNWAKEPSWKNLFFRKKKGE